MNNKLIDKNIKFLENVPNVFLIKNYITKKNIEIGNFTYYHDFRGEEFIKNFENNNVLYHFSNMMYDKLIIDKFCLIA